MLVNHHNRKDTGNLRMYIISKSQFLFSFWQCSYSLKVRGNAFFNSIAQRLPPFHRLCCQFIYAKSLLRDKEMQRTLDAREDYHSPPAPSSWVLTAVMWRIIRFRVAWTASQADRISLRHLAIVTNHQFVKQPRGFLHQTSFILP